MNGKEKLCWSESLAFVFDLSPLLSTLARADRTQTAWSELMEGGQRFTMWHDAFCFDCVVVHKLLLYLIKSADKYYIHKTWKNILLCLKKSIFTPWTFSLFVLLSPLSLILMIGILFDAKTIVGQTKELKWK